MKTSSKLLVALMVVVVASLYAPVVHAQATTGPCGGTTIPVKHFSTGFTGLPESVVTGRVYSLADPGIAVSTPVDMICRSETVGPLQ